MGATIGWDVGGAHLKGARVREGRVEAVVQIACPLWLGMDRLETALAEARGQLGEAERQVVTTTGELTDHFATRADGVTQIAALMAKRLAPARLSFYAGPSGFVAPHAAAQHVGQVASANWHASAAWLALHVADALFVDMGSTTTDIIPVTGGKVSATGYGDAERLAEGELVYTGLTRTFLMSVSPRVPFRGRLTPLMNEYFASMADVHRILGQLDEAHDLHATADGREKTPRASMARLARMVGCDVVDASDKAWTDLARWFAEAQLRSVEDAVRQVLSRVSLASDAPMVAAGTGHRIVDRLAQRLERRCVGFDTLFEVSPEARSLAGTCAPAVALALLADAAAPHA